MVNGGCQGALDYGTCYPYHVWSGTSYTTGGYYYDRYFIGGSFDSKYYVPAYAFSVRCVLDLTSTYSFVTLISVLLTVLHSAIRLMMAVRVQFMVQGGLITATLSICGQVRPPEVLHIRYTS